MNTQQLIAYYDNNNIQSYHGSKILDALKYLSELDLPTEIREDYYLQYEAALKNTGTSRNKNFGELLYNKFLDKQPIVKGDIVKSFTLRDIITFNAVEVKLVRLEHVAKYLKEHGITSGREKTTYVVLDININGISTLQSLLDKPKSNRRYCSFSETLMLCDDKEYALINSFYKPYNGIEATSVVDIFKNIVNKEDDTNGNSWSRPSFTNTKSYLGRVLSHYHSYVDVQPMLDVIKTLGK